MFWHLDKMFFLLISLFQNFVDLTDFFFFSFNGLQSQFDKFHKKSCDFNRNHIHFTFHIHFREYWVSPSSFWYFTCLCLLFMYCIKFLWLSLYICFTSISRFITENWTHTHTFWILSPSNCLVVNRKVFLWSSGVWPMDCLICLNIYFQLIFLDFFRYSFLMFALPLFSCLVALLKIFEFLVVR